MKKPYIFPLLLGSLVLTGCVNSQMDAMQMRLNQQEQQIRLLSSQLSGVQPAQADTWAQVQSLRQEMSAVKGQIDDFNNATAAAGGLPGLAQRVNNHEAALQAIATQFGMELPVAAAPGDPGTLPATPGMADATAAPAMQPQQAAPTPQQAAPQTQAQSDIAKALYDNGVQSFNARNYKQALKSFSDFTDTTPSTGLFPTRGSGAASATTSLGISRPPHWITNRSSPSMVRAGRPLPRT